MYIAIKTDNPMAELYILNGATVIAEKKWEAHRTLSDTIHVTLEELMKQPGVSYHDITGIIVYKGPGSFTGLRIGATVGNTLAYALQVPIIGVNEADWLLNGVQLLSSGKKDAIVVPDYGADVHITAPKK